MKIKQREIVNVDFQFPDGKSKNHYAVVVSNNDLIESEGFVYLVLITSKDYHSEYYYELSNDMFTNFSLSKKSYVKCHILMTSMEYIIPSKLGTMKKAYFDEMVDKIIKSIF